MQPWSHTQTIHHNVDLVREYTRIRIQGLTLFNVLLGVLLGLLLGAFVMFSTRTFFFLSVFVTLLLFASVALQIMIMQLAGRSPAFDSTLEMDEQGMRWNTKNQKLSMKWSDLKSIHRKGSFLFFRSQNGNLIAIPAGELEAEPARFIRTEFKDKIKGRQSLFN